MEKPRTGRNASTDNDILLESDQVVDLAADDGVGEHACGLLEAGRTQEGFASERGASDAEEHRTGDGRFLTSRDDLPVRL